MVAGAIIVSSIIVEVTSFSIVEDSSFSESSWVVKFVIISLLKILVGPLVVINVLVFCKI